MRGEGAHAEYTRACGTAGWVGVLSLLTLKEPFLKPARVDSLFACVMSPCRAWQSYVICTE